MKQLFALAMLIMLIIFTACKKDEIKETVTDIDGNVYNTVTIGKQVWMVENLRVSHYNNGDPILKITDQNTWQHANSGACCAYANIDDNTRVYGNLYNWFAVNDGRKLAPAGWHIPTDEEWFTLQYAIGDYTIAGGRMKQAGTAFWFPPNSGADNKDGFNALPGGRRDGSTGFTGIRYFAFWWSATETTSNTLYASYRKLVHDSPYISWSNYFKTDGMAVRCVKD